MARKNNGFQPLLKKMQNENLPTLVIDNFKHYYDLLVAGQTGNLPETGVTPLEALPDMDEMATDERVTTGKKFMDRTVIVKLNGGLGTGMGMQKAKSLLHVKDGLTFLDIIVRQARALHANPRSRWHWLRPEPVDRQSVRPWLRPMHWPWPRCVTACCRSKRRCSQYPDCAS